MYVWSIINKNRIKQKALLSKMLYIFCWKEECLVYERFNFAKFINIIHARH